MDKIILSMQDVKFLNDWFIKITDYVDCTVIPISKIEIDIDMFRVSDDCDPVDLKMIVEHRGNKFKAHFNVNGATFGNIYFRIHGSGGDLPTVDSAQYTVYYSIISATLNESLTLSKLIPVFSIIKRVGRDKFIKALHEDLRCIKEVYNVERELWGGEVALYFINIYISVMTFMVYGSEFSPTGVNNISEMEHRSHEQIIQDVKQRFSNVSSNVSSGSTVYLLKKYKGSPRLCVQGVRQKPSEEFSVRGHYRHYKSGKVVWVDEFSKCKDSGNKRDKTYRL